MKTDYSENPNVKKSQPADSAGQYGTVEGKVRSVVMSMGEALVPEMGADACVSTPAYGKVHYTFNDWTRANIDIDKIPLPCIVYILPPSGTFLLKNGHAKDIPEAAIAFLDRTVLDDNSVIDDSVVEKMKRLALAFIDSVNGSGLFETVEGELRYQVPVDILDSIVSGIIIHPKLKEVAGVRLCDTNLIR